MKNLRPFEIILIGIFGAAAIGSLIYVAVFKANNDQSLKPYGDKVVVWGTLDKAAVNDAFSKIKETNKAFAGAVTYVEKDRATFDSELVNAIADGNPPDLVVLPGDKLVFYRTKLLPLSYKTIPERTFRDTYVDGAEIFMRSDGVYGIPFGADPLVLFWNRDMFSSNGLANPPRTWEQLVGESTPVLTRKDAAFNITKSAISLGEYINISHPKQILAMLLLQAGSTLVEEQGTTYRVTLNDSHGGGGLPPGDASLSFYTQFSNPTNPNYAWNRSLTEDRLMFLGGDLGMYFGLGSELNSIKQANPNLNFDVAPVPQGSGATVLRDYADFYAFAIPRTSKNQNGAYAAAQLISNEENAERLDNSLGFAPVLRSLIAAGSSDPFKQIIYQSSLVGRGWLDPNPAQSDDVFKQMVQDITSGRSPRISDAVNTASKRLELLFK